MEYVDKINRAICRYIHSGDKRTIRVGDVSGAVWNALEIPPDSRGGASETRWNLVWREIYMSDSDLRGEVLMGLHAELSPTEDILKYAD